MRAMFWQRKNARLTARLNTLVETSERVRKSRRRKPRVIIDQTYVQTPPVDAPDTSVNANQSPVDSDANSELDLSLSNEDQGESNTEEDRAEWLPDETPESSENSDTSGLSDEETEENAILHEAIDQLDQAEQREAEALGEIDRLRTQLQQEIEARRLAEATSNPVQPTVAPDPEGGELSAARHEIDRLQSVIESEKAARTVAETERDEAMDAASVVSAAEANNETLLNEIETLRQALADEKAARKDIEAARDEAIKVAANQDVNQTNAAISTNAAASGDLAIVKAEADARVAVARREADTQRRLMDKLRKELIVVQTAKEMAEAQLQSASGASVEQQDSIQAALATRDLAESKLSETEDTLQQLRQEVAGLNDHLSQQKSSLETITKERDDLLGRAERAEMSAAELEQTKKQAADAQSELSLVNQELTNLKTTLAEADERATLAEQRVQEVETELSDLRKTAARSEFIEKARDQAISDAETLRQEADGLRDKFDKQATELSDMRVAVAQSDERAGLAEQRIAETETELAELRKSAALHDEAVKVHAQVEERAAAASVQLDEQSAQIQQLTSELSALTNRLTDADAELVALRETASLHDDAVKTAENASARADEAAAKNAAQSDQIQQYQSDVAALRGQLQEANERAAQAEVQRKELEAELAKAREQSRQESQADERVTRLKAAEKRARAEIEDQNSKLAEMTTQVSEMRLRFSATDKKRVQAEERCTELDKELAALRQTTGHGEISSSSEQELPVDVAAAQRAANEQRDRAEQLEKSLEEFRQRLAQADAKALQAATRSESLETELAQLRDATPAQAQDDEQAADTQIADQNAQIEALNNEVANLRASLEESTASGENTDALHDELTQLREALAQAETERDDANAQAEDLQKELAAASQLQIADDRSDQAAQLATSQKSQTALSEGQTQEIAAAVKQVAATAARRSEPVADMAHSLGRLPPVAATSQLAISATTSTGASPSVSPALDAAPEPTISVSQSRIKKALTPKEKMQEARRARRLSSRKVAQLWQEGMSAALSCTMIDRSSTGAKLEIMTDRFNDRMNDISVGDRYTLSITYAQERTSMVCEVMWVSGRQCGVEFCGQIHTEIVKTPKKALPRKEPEKPKPSKKFSSLFRSNSK